MCTRPLATSMDLPPCPLPRILLLYNLKKTTGAAVVGKAANGAHQAERDAGSLPSQSYREVCG